MLKLLRTVLLLLFLFCCLSCIRVGSVALVAGPNEAHTCFEGYVLYDDMTCVREINQDPISACPEAPTSSKGCRVEIPHITRCPDGYTNSNGKCSSAVKIDASFFCPTDFTDNGEDCLRVTPTAPVLSCEIGELIRSNCVLITRQEPVLTTRCPSDAFLEDNACWKVLEEFPCERQLQETSTVYEDVSLGSRSLAKEDFLRGRSRSAPQKRLFGEPELVPVSKPHLSLVKVIQQICQRRVQVESQILAECQAGFTEENKLCIQEQIFPPQPICPMTGQVASIEGCPPVIHRTPKLARCPDGGLVVANQCHSLLTAAPLFLCPVDFKDNGVFCEGYFLPPLECAAGLQMIGGRCIGKIVRQALTFRIAPNFRQELVVPESEPSQRRREEKKDEPTFLAAKLLQRRKEENRDESVFLAAKLLQRRKEEKKDESVDPESQSRQRRKEEKRDEFVVPESQSRQRRKEEKRDESVDPESQSRQRRKEEKRDEFVVPESQSRQRRKEEKKDESVDPESQSRQRRKEEKKDESVVPISEPPQRRREKKKDEPVVMAAEPLESRRKKELASDFY